LPIDIFRSTTDAIGMPPPAPGGVVVVLRLLGSFEGNGIHVLPLSLERNTLSFDHLHPREYNYELGRALAKSFAALPARPTAFISLNDEIAAGAIRGFSESGIAVPRDVSVTGFNNQDLCMVSSPQLTSVDQQIPETIEKAVSVLFAQIGMPSPAEPMVELIRPRIVLRESTGPAARP